MQTDDDRVLLSLGGLEDTDTDLDSEEEDVAYRVSYELSMPWTPISSFAEIQIPPNTIVFCDIDDTVIHHPRLNYSWVQFVLLHFQCKYMESNPEEYDPKIPLNAYDAYVKKLMATTHPVKPTDFEGFMSVAQSSTKFIFITARHPTTLEITRNDLTAVGIDPHAYSLHFSGSTPKGVYIVQNFNLTKYDNVLFIDDQLYNLINVSRNVKHPGLKIYKYEHEKEPPHEYYPLPEEINPKLRFNGEYIE